MNNFVVVAALLAVMAFAYHVGLTRSRAAASDGAALHSRPFYYGTWVALWCGLPALTVLILWQFIEPRLLRAVVGGMAPADLVQTGGMQLVGALRRVETIAAGGLVSGDILPWEQAAANTLSRLGIISSLAMVAAMAAAAALGLTYAKRRITPQLRARNQVERVVGVALALCSLVAILTTLGIVVSLFSEAMVFFGMISPIDFFFGTTWNPRFQSTAAAGEANFGQFGVLPLLWGTVMVSFIAMAVAVPIGLMSAIYMAEYAAPRFRAVAKPALEVLAGIPTIVYGFIALTVVGPALSGFGALLGLEVRATSALTAGLVMGIMIIPFVSSLSDDIITQVPRAMRDGSLALGATRAETIRLVLLPAALPGIVGAMLLAVSRAIGETMIVVLAAGNSPVLRANPLEPTSTMTVTIVNQLTGDIDFTSPQSLVAFAIGLTLFVLTLGLNVIALHVVRKYREQYE